jgi:hypothetical protein
MSAEKLRKAQDAPERIGAEYRSEPAQTFPGHGPAQAADRVMALAEGGTPRPRAVFVAHGMGQQIPFQTLDAVAKGLRRADLRQPTESAARPPVVRTVLLGEERLQRIELSLLTEDGEREVHVYEGYWAPFTEGQVTLRDVIRFLLTAGLHGIKNGMQPFRRWLFGDYYTFWAPIRTILFLLTALAVLGALTVINSMIVVVGAALTPCNEAPCWLSRGLFADLSTTLNLWLVFVVLFGLSVCVAAWLRRRAAAGPRPCVCLWAGYMSVLWFVAVLFATIAAGIAMLFLLLLHTRAGADAATTEYWAVLASRRTVESFNYYVSGILFFGLLAGVVWVVGRFLVNLFRAWRHERTSREVAGSKAFSAGVVGLFWIFVTGVVFEILLFFFASRASGQEIHLAWSTILRGVAWPLLLGVSAFVRHLLIQYVGDVAAYVQPHTLDRFYDLRARIKEAIRKTARAIYAARQADGNFLYESVTLVGHSLGSVIVYDTLNRLLLDDALARAQDALGGTASPAEVLDAADRTRGLVTFGSPLDKTAFLFGLQGGETTEAREALAASVQPLIQEDRFRTFPWINIFSRWDLISGRLDYYDTPDRLNRNPVDNQVDPDATTLLAAHTEYWKNPLLFNTLLAHL